MKSIAVALAIVLSSIPAAARRRPPPAPAVEVVPVPPWLRTEKCLILTRPMPGIYIWRTCRDLGRGL